MRGEDRYYVGIWRGDGEWLGAVEDTSAGSAVRDACRLIAARQ